jgi:hypothetical protein
VKSTSIPQTFSEKYLDVNWIQNNRIADQGSFSQVMQLSDFRHTFVWFPLRVLKNKRGVFDGLVEKKCTTTAADLVIFGTDQAKVGNHGNVIFLLGGH